MAVVTGESVLFKGRWLGLKAVSWQAPDGRTRIWEALERSNHGKAPADAVEIIAVLRAPPAPKRLVLVAQFRPPVGRVMLELPAGLADAGEQPSAAALRELKEETGFSGELVAASFPVWFGMAISNTSCAIVHVNVDGSLPANQAPRQRLDEGEFAEVVLLPLDGLLQRLEQLERSGAYGIDAKLWLIAYMLGAGASLAAD